MDVIIPLLNHSPNNYFELRFALRSFDKWLMPENVIIVGGKPDWFTGFHIHHDDYNAVSKEKNIYRKVKLGSHYTSGNFYYANDDEFLLGKYQGLIHKGSMLHTAEAKAANGSYRKSLDNTMIAFGGVIDNYDIHYPTIMNRNGIEAIDEKLFNQPFGVTFRTSFVYSNNLQSLGRCMPDNKVNFIPQKINTPYFSTSDNCTNLGILKIIYPKPSRWEK